MPRPYSGRKRQIALRVTEAEYVRIQAAAKRAKRTIADWSRLKLVASAPELKTEADGAA